MTKQNFSEMLDTADINSMFESSVDLEDTNTDKSDNSVDGDGDNKDDKTDDVNLSIDSIFENAEVSDDVDNEDNEDNDSLDSDDDSDSSSSDSAPSNFTTILAKDLMDRGIISSFDEDEFKKVVDEKGETQALRDLVSGEISQASDNIKKDYDEGYQEYLDMVEGGVDKGTANSLVKTKETFDNIDEDTLDDEDNEELRRGILTEHYKFTTSFNDSKIKKLVNRSFELGEDVEEAKDALVSIKEGISSRIEDEKVAAKEAAANESKALEESKNTLKSSIEGIKEILPGQRINKQTKDKMYDLITKPVSDKNGNTTNGLWAKRSEDPVEFDQKLAYLVETGFFEKGKSWDKVKNIKVTEEASKLEEFVKNSGSRRNGRVSINTSRSKDTDSLLDSMKSIL